jgi:hypothetical protein
LAVEWQQTTFVAVVVSSASFGHATNNRNNGIDVFVGIRWTMTAANERGIVRPTRQQGILNVLRPVTFVAPGRRRVVGQATGGKNRIFYGFMEE